MYHNGSLDVNSKTGEIGFPAGCVTVSYNPTLNIQSRFTIAVPQESGKLKPITSVTYARDGLRMASAESGHNPSIYVWNLELNSLSVELKSHTRGVACMAFAQGDRTLISMGTEHDQQLNVWDLRTSSPIRSCKVTSKVHAVAVNSEGNTFVTVGLRHLKVWNVGDLSSNAISGPSLKQYEFVDAVWGKGSLATFLWTVSRDGVLFAIDMRTRTEAMQIDLKTSVSALTLIDQYIAVACAKGVVHLLHASTLEFVATLPKPNPIGVEFATLDNPHLFKQSSQTSLVLLRESKGVDSEKKDVFPDVVAIKSVPLETNRLFVVCFYNNRSFFIWDLTNIRQVAKYRSFLSNSACVWGLDIFPSEAPKPNSAFPSNSFATCSADGSVRIWNTDTGGKNVFSKDLLASYSLSAAQDVYQALLQSGPVDGLGGSLVGSATTAMALPTGVRSICISPDGEEVATGDRSGNVRIHRTSDFALRSLQEAHESEVLCLSYNRADLSSNYAASKTSGTNNASAGNHDSQSATLLASGSRDRLIHVFARSPNTSTLSHHSHRDIEVSKAFKKASVTGVEYDDDSDDTNSNDASEPTYSLVSTMDDHSASITAVAFAENGSSDLFSTSADKSVIFRHITSNGGSVKRYHNMITHGVMLDMKVVPATRKKANSPSNSSNSASSYSSTSIVVLAGQDKKIAVHDIKSGALLRTIATQSDADILKLEIDSSGLLLATASQDRLLRLYNFATGELLASMAGHSEIITGVKFTPDGSQVISISGDGCIFVWNVSSELVTAMKSRKKVASAFSSPAKPLRADTEGSPLHSTTLSPSVNQNQTPNVSGSAKVRRNLAPSPQGSLALSPPSSSGKRSSISAQALLERIISPAYLPTWAQTGASSDKQKSKIPDQQRSAWASRCPETITIATCESYKQTHGALSLSSSSARKRLSLDPTVSLPSVPSYPGITVPRSSSSYHAISKEDEPAIIFATDEEEIKPKLGPVIRSLDTTRANEDESPSASAIDDPSAFFAELSKPTTAGENDVLHQQNFGNLNHSFVPTTSTNKGRKSISARYFLKRPLHAHSNSDGDGQEEVKTTESESEIPRIATPPTSSDITSGVIGSASTSMTAEERREQMARDVERTKARLREMGIHFGTKPSPAPKMSKSALTESMKPIEMQLTTMSPSSDSSSADTAITNVPAVSSISNASASPLRASANSLITKSMGDLPALSLEDDTSTSLPVDNGENANEELEEAEEVEYAAGDEEVSVRPAFLESLMGGFERTVELYKELKESEQQDDMVHQFRSVFAEMKATLDILSSEDSILSSMASDRTYELTGSTTLECTEAAMLERYSELLVGLVHSKLTGPRS